MLNPAPGSVNHIMRVRGDRMARCVVLGANGFIGSHLVDSLVSFGHDVRAFDRFSNHTRKFSAEQVEVVSGDFLNRHDLAEAIRGMEYVFHFISTTTPISAEDDPIIDIETNVKQSVELFQECVHQKIKGVIFASTGGAIYGSGYSDKVNEEALPQPVSPYAIGKLTIEHYLRYFSKKHDLKSVSYRISNPFGERQSMSAKQGVIPIFLWHIAHGEPITVLGDGSMVRDYIYVKDVADMIAQSFDKATKSTYNLGSGRGVSVNELVSVIKKMANHKVDIRFKDSPATFIEKVVLDTTRFTNEFDIRPKVYLEDGIKDTWRYVLDNARKDKS